MPAFSLPASHFFCICVHLCSSVANLWTMDLLSLEPLPTLLSRVRGELGASFDAECPVRIARAPGRLDVMGGIADYTGSLVCEMPLRVGTGVALQERPDRQVSVMSFNLFDDHRPFQFAISLDALAKATADSLRRDLAAPGRAWAGYVIGCLFLLHEKGHIDLADPQHRGLNLAVLSTVPEGAGVSSSAALEVATMINLVGHFASGDFTSLSNLKSDGLRLAALCQEVENRIVGAPCGIMDQVTSILGEPGKLLRLLCQPHELQPPLILPAGVAVVGINTNVTHRVGGGAYGRTRIAAFMGHRLILDHMRRLAQQVGKTMTGDPTGGYLANLAAEDYKQLFRPKLPEAMDGGVFLERFSSHGDPATAVDPQASYPVQAACDHHVLEAQRVRRFVGFLGGIDEIGREKALRSAGHLMYASHKSYTDKAGLGAEAADLLVDLVKKHEPVGLYGARITGGGSGGTVAVLMEDTGRAREAMEAVSAAYRAQTGLNGEIFDGSSPGAGFTGTALVNL